MISAAENWEKSTIKNNVNMPAAVLFYSYNLLIIAIYKFVVP
jgi:hypothetical protein